MEKRCSILIDDSSNRKMGANFLDKDTLFTLWFNSINVCFPKVGVYRDNQGKANKKKMKNINTSRNGIEEKLGTSGTSKPDKGGVN